MGCRLDLKENPLNVTVVEGDLLDQDVDVIVNAWNRNIIPWWLLLPQGVSGAIKKRGGNGLLLLYLNVLLHIGNLSFQMPYSQDLIVAP